MQNIKNKYMQTINIENIYLCLWHCLTTYQKMKEGNLKTKAEVDHIRLNN